jgi:hypothetical protein
MMTQTKSNKVEPARILATGINEIADKYIFRAVLMEAIKATAGHATAGEIEYELRTVYDMMSR